MNVNVSVGIDLLTVVNFDPVMAGRFWRIKSTSALIKIAPFAGLDPKMFQIRTNFQRPVVLIKSLYCKGNLATTGEPLDRIDND